MASKTTDSYQSDDIDDDIHSEFSDMLQSIHRNHIVTLISHARLKHLYLEDMRVKIEIDETDYWKPTQEYIKDELQIAIANSQMKL